MKYVLFIHALFSILFVIYTYVSMYWNMCCWYIFGNVWTKCHCHIMSCSFYVSFTHLYQIMKYVLLIHIILTKCSCHIYYYPCYVSSTHMSQSMEYVLFIHNTKMSKYVSFSHLWLSRKKNHSWNRSYLISINLISIRCYKCLTPHMLTFK